MESSEDTAPIADEYVEEFVLDHFGDMNIKKEAVAVPNASGGTDEDMLPVTSATAASSTPSSSSTSTSMPSSGPTAPTPPSNSDEDCNDKKSSAFLVDCQRETTELPHIGCNSSSTVSSSVEDQLHHHSHHPNHQYQQPADDAVSPEAGNSLLTSPTSLHLMHTPHHYSQLSPTSSSSSSHLQHNHHSSGIVLANPKSAGSANSSLLVYQNIHGTPPDTPPVVHNSPSPQACGYPVAHAQSYYTQPPMYSKSSSFMDDMVLLTTTTHHRQEPLDLRPNCNSGSSNNENPLDGSGAGGGGLPLGQQNWNVLQHNATPVITPGNSKRMYHSADYIHPQHHHHHHHHNHNHHQLQQHHPHQYQPQQQPDLLLPPFPNSVDGTGQIGLIALPMCPPSPNIGGVTTGGIPTTKVIAEPGRGSSRSGRGHTVVIPSDFNENTSSSNSSSCNDSIISNATNSSGGGIGKLRLTGSHGNGGCGGMDISDEMLLCLTVKDLNKKLQGIPKDLIALLKQKRRTLKNRGYAQNCRSKRLVQRQELEMSKQSLQQDLSRTRMQLNRALEERDFYRNRYHEMLKLQGIHHHHSSVQDINTRQNIYSINVNHSVAATAGTPDNLYL